MPTPTYVPLATETLSGSDSSITFSSVPATFRDLILVIAGTSASATTFGVQCNSDSASNYTFVEMSSDGGGTSSSGSLTYLLMGRSTTSQGVSTLQIMDYAQTDKHKTAIARGSTSSIIVRASAARWANTAAVTSLTVTGSNWSSGTTLSLYGVN